jgi:hypothetical protein
MASRHQWCDRKATLLVEGRPHLPCRQTFGRSSTVGPVRDSQCLEVGFEASSAELVYGSPLRLPEEFFVPLPADCIDVTDFASRLRVQIGKLCPVPALRHVTPSTFIFKDLATASHVFLRHGAHKGALQAPYAGPYRVLQRVDKNYTIEVLGGANVVSIDRLKPAYVLHVDTESASPPASPSSLTTRSGRRVCFPDYLGVQRSWRGWGGVAGATG